jgi:hypothetical protein
LVNEGVVKSELIELLNRLAVQGDKRDYEALCMHTTVFYVLNLGEVDPKSNH